MPKLTIRGAYIRFVDVRYDEKSKTVYTKINFTASFSDPVRDAMEWGAPPPGFASAKLDGELVAKNLVLTPNGNLKNHEFELDAKEIGNFEVVRIANESGDGTTLELRFQVVSGDSAAPRKLQTYLSNVGKGEAVLKVGYEAQSELEMEAEGEQERLISEEQAADTSEAADEPKGRTRKAKA